MPDPDPVTRLNAALEGRYRIERELGAGGMATVYLADDLRHERKVAVKVLKPELAAVVGAERFLAEIKTTANLQHPHILPLFDSGEADGFLFYVMPYVEGETLRDRIDREKQLPVDEALGIATAVANALHTAHEQGIVHRDIKPANILLSRGEPLVADFGIALAVGAAGGSRLTETGLSVGTPYYMSPEQATGDQVVGPASDIYALGCVLYEMLVGEPPYLGNTAQAVLGKIIQGLPVSATAARKSIPRNVDAAIRKALEKLPADRFTDAHGFAKALGDSGFRHGAEAETAAESSDRWKRVAMITSGIAAGAVLAAGWGFLADSGQPVSVMRQEIAPVAGGMARAVGTYSALAPDGSSMVYALATDDGQSRNLWLKPRDAAEATLLPGTEGAQNITYSPDSRWIAFAAGSELKKRPIGDGSTVTLAEGLTPAPNSMIALAWLDDGTILFELPGNVLMRIPEGGGQADTVVAYGDQGIIQLSYAGALPGSRGALVSLCPEVCQQTTVVGVVDFEADTTRILLDDAIRGWYTPIGQLMYVRSDGAVFAAPFDLDALELTGPGIPLFDGVVVNLTSPQLSVAWDGTMLIGTGVPTSSDRELVWVDRSGQAELVDPDMGPALYQTLSLSPDDNRVAVTIVGTDVSGAPAPELWVKELPNGPSTRLTTHNAFTRRPHWSLDGRSVAYVTNEGGAYTARSVAADGSSGSAFELLLERERQVYEVFFTPDGSGMLYREGNPTTQAGGDIGLLDLSTDSVTPSLLSSEFDENNVSLSPDGRWMAYVSNASGQAEVFVRPFPQARSQVQVSTNGGLSPVWAHNGRELFYIDGDDWISVATFATDPSFSVETRERLLDASVFYHESVLWPAFDVAVDDQRFLMIRPVGAATASQTKYIYVQNYFEELKERVGG
jgi:serine/threonine-protein kinase